MLLVSQLWWNYGMFNHIPFLFFLRARTIHTYRLYAAAEKVSATASLHPHTERGTRTCERRDSELNDHHKPSYGTIHPPASWNTPSTEYCTIGRSKKIWTSRRRRWSCLPRIKKTTTEKIIKVEMPTTTKNCEMKLWNFRPVELSRNKETPALLLSRSGAPRSWGPT